MSRYHIYRRENANPNTTEQNILQALDILRHMYHVEKMTPKQIQEQFGVEYSAFGMFLKNVGIKYKK